MEEEVTEVVVVDTAAAADTAAAVAVTLGEARSVVATLEEVPSVAAMSVVRTWVVCPWVVLQAAASEAMSVAA